MGGLDKAELTLHGVSSLEWLLGGLQAAAEVIVVAPERPTSRPVVFCVERPRFGGPVAALGAALAQVRAPVVAVLGVDAPGGASIVELLVHELDASIASGLMPVDAQGRAQPLGMVVRAAQLRLALARLQPLAGRSMRELVQELGLQPRRLSAKESGLLTDFDTAEQLDDVRRRVAVAFGATPGITMTNGMQMSLERWVQELRTELAIDDEIDVDAILDLTRVAAHAVQRPAAPLTAYMLGLAVARGADFTLSAQAVQLAAESWERSQDEQPR